ncbi:ABC transporter substrate-binding protein [Phytoactinopolyspora halophila]|uniref:ABC transporter substrate-binding protein n=1 Tax=Phytoactinopolyspora halophila TaxID=1981511 RepID=A0A329QYV5_9ACTN|nr:ABC transporter substrate-binding protein [Phytoactinopolyspora halophila]
MAAVAVLAAGCVEDGAADDEEATAVEGLAGEGSGEECTIEEPVPVGVVFSLTGGAAFAGEYQREGLELAFEEINGKGGVEYELVLEDDATELEDSIAAFEKLIERDEVSIIVGPTLSDMAFSTFEDAQQAGVPVLGISTTAKGIPDIGDYVFRNSIPEEVALAQSLPAARDALGLENVAVMHDNEDEFTSSAYTTMTEVLDEEGIEIVGDETFQTADTEFRSQLTKIREDDPDALVLSALPAATVPLVQQARELGLDVPIVGGNAFNSPVMIDNLEDAAEGLIVGGAWSDALDSPGNAEFIESYTDTYDRAPDQFAAQAYTAAHMIDAAVRAGCDGNREAIKTNLGQLSELDTVLGTLSLDENGEVHHEPVVQIVEDGEFTLLDG